MRSTLVPLALALVLASCNDGGSGSSAMLPAVSTTSAAPTSAAPAMAATTVPSSTSITIGPTSTMTSTPAVMSEEIEIGRSVEGRPITAIHRGKRGATVVLVVGDIHGDEAAGVAVVQDLETAAVPGGIDLWLVESMNPDGMAAGRRQNADLVDLNRNFPYRWALMGEPGHWEYSGPSAASEPETAAMVALIDGIRPELTIWYHQDLHRLSPATGRRGEVTARYAELTGLPLKGISGGTYTGTAGPHAQSVVPGGISLTVELGPGDLATAEVATHADAVLTVSSELATP